MNPVNALLMANNSAIACRVLIALLVLGPLPVASTAIVERYAMDNESVKRGLNALHTLELVTYEGEAKRTAWRITPDGRRLALDLFGLAQALPDQLALPNPLPLLADPDSIAVKPQSASEPENQASPEPESIAVKPQSSAAIIIVNRQNQSLTDSVNNNNKGRPSIAVKPQSKAERKHAQHIAAITSALLLKGAPHPTADDYLPPDLRLCAQHLVTLGCSADRAEAAVVKSPWPAEKIIEQLAIWKVYPDCPMGANLKHNFGFPYVVAKRIEDGEVCPFDNRQLETASKYDGYSAYAANT